MAKILECRHIDKTYQTGKLEVPVLHDVNFSMEAGEYVAVMGPSGSGKSTLMNIIGCLDRLTEGELYLDGEPVSSLSEKELALLRLRKIGFVFQTFQLLPGETALGNVELPLTYAKVPRKKRREIAVEALEKVGLGDRLDFKPSQLSGGQKQRVAIARAMVNHPKILLADEPTGALDSKSGAQVMELFRSLNQEGVSVLMITHNREIAACADRIVELRDGVLHEDGSALQGAETSAMPGTPRTEADRLLENASDGFFDDVEDFADDEGFAEDRSDANLFEEPLDFGGLPEDLDTPPDEPEDMGILPEVEEDDSEEEGNPAYLAGGEMLPEAWDGAEREHAEADEAALTGGRTENLAEAGEAVPAEGFAEGLAEESAGDILVDATEGLSGAGIAEAGLAAAGIGLVSAGIALAGAKCDDEAQALPESPEEGLPSKNEASSEEEELLAREEPANEEEIASDEAEKILPVTEEALPAAEEALPVQEEVRPVFEEAFQATKGVLSATGEEASAAENKTSEYKRGETASANETPFDEAFSAGDENLLRYEGGYWDELDGLSAIPDILLDVPFVISDTVDEDAGRSGFSGSGSLYEETHSPAFEKAAYEEKAAWDEKGDAREDAGKNPEAGELVDEEPDSRERVSESWNEGAGRRAGGPNFRNEEPESRERGPESWNEEPGSRVGGPESRNEEADSHAGESDSRNEEAENDTHSNERKENGMAKNPGNVAVETSGKERTKTPREPERFSEDVEQLLASLENSPEAPGDTRYGSGDVDLLPDELEVLDLLLKEP